MLKKQNIKNVDDTFETIGKAAKQAQNVPIGYMFIIMICVIAVTWYVSQKSYEERYKDCKKEKEKLENHFIYKQIESQMETKKLEDSLYYFKNKWDYIDSILEEKSELLMQKLK